MLIALSALFIIWRYDPSDSVWMPKCMIHSLTGLQCPGCGITRALHAALHGNFMEAIHYNLFLVISLPYLLAVGMVSYVPLLWRRDGLRRVVLGVPLAATYVVLFLIWFVVRNILKI